jgi:hypothetical protein
VNWSQNKTSMILFTLAFLAVGMLSGTLLGFSDEKLAQGFLAALFTLFGGSLIALLRKLTVVDQIKAAGGLGAIAAGTLIGVYSSIYVNEYQLLTPPELRHPQHVLEASSPVPNVQIQQATAKGGGGDAHAQTEPTSNAHQAGGELTGDLRSARPCPEDAAREKYLRANVMSEVDAIDQRYRNGLSPKEAYSQLLGVIRAQTK